MSIFKKHLDTISDLLQKISTGLKTPQPPKSPKVPGAAPLPKKNPIKIAEQKQADPEVKVDLDAAKIKNAGQWQEKLKMSENGQWSLTKIDANKVIGTTRSGKQIYTSAKHSGHSSFNESDHQDAALHQTRIGTKHSMDQANIHLDKLDAIRKD